MPFPLDVLLFSHFTKGKILILFANISVRTNSVELYFLCKGNRVFRDKGVGIG